MDLDSPLADMPAEEFRKAGHEIIDWIADYLAEPRKRAVMTDIVPGQLVDQLPAQAPEQGEPFEAIFRDFQVPNFPEICMMENISTVYCYILHSVNFPFFRYVFINNKI